MDEGILIEKLMAFGLSRQEASIYLCLMKQESLSGYEVSKQTGISRSNVYNSLSSLTEKGAASLIEGNPAKYVAVEISEFCTGVLRSLKRDAEYLQENLKFETENSEGYISIMGYKNIRNKLQYMLEHAKERIYLSITADKLRVALPELTDCAKRGIKVVIITDEEMKLPFECQYYVSEEKGDQIRLIVDSHYVLTGEIRERVNDNCLYCAQENFVNVFKDALRNEIKLIRISKGEANE